MEDWGVNVAIVKRVLSHSVLHAIQGTRFFRDGFGIDGIYVAPKLRQAKMAADVWTSATYVRDLLHMVYAELKASRDGKMGIVVIDLPFAGAGLELSAFKTRGKMYVSNPSSWIGPD